MSLNRLLRCSVASDQRLHCREDGGSVEVLVNRGRHPAAREDQPETHMLGDTCWNPRIGHEELAMLLRKDTDTEDSQQNDQDCGAESPQRPDYRDPTSHRHTSETPHIALCLPVSSGRVVRVLMAPSRFRVLGRHHSPLLCLGHHIQLTQ